MYVVMIDKPRADSGSRSPSLSHQPVNGHQRTSSTASSQGRRGNFSI